MIKFGIVLVIHFIADFLLQSRMMGENKSKSMYWLSMHILIYTLTLAVLSYPLFIIKTNFVVFVLINSFLHFITDYNTSRMTSRFYSENRMKEFWSTIGGDQLIHGLCLYYTFLMLV